MINIAIIGVGNIAETHMLAYRANPEVNVVAFCDINPDRLAFMGEKWGVTKLFTDMNDMFKEVPEIDAVSVCTWNAAHAPCTIAALKDDNVTLTMCSLQNTIVVARWAIRSVENVALENDAEPQI